MSEKPPPGGFFVRLQDFSDGFTYCRQPATKSNLRTPHMRLLLMYALSAAAMSACVVSVGHTQSAKAPAGDVRYFTSLGDLMGERAVDAFIKETRQSGKVVAATLDACYSVSPTSDRKDRFNIELKIDGQKISGSGQSLEAKSPVRPRGFDEAAWRQLRGAFARIATALARRDAAAAVAPDGVPRTAS